MSEPDRPNSEDENAVPMPASGADRPVFRASSIELASPPAGSSAWIVSPMDLIVSKQAPECAEQAEKHQQAGQIARNVARLVEARGDGIQQRAQRRGGQRHGLPPADQRLHRRQQHRFSRARPVAVAAPVGVDPGDFAEQAEHLQNAEQNADDQNRDDQAVEAGIGDKGRRRPDGRELR